MVADEASACRQRRLRRPRTTIERMFPMMPTMAIGIEIQTALTQRIVGIMQQNADDDSDDDDDVADDEPAADDVLLSVSAIAQLAFITSCRCTTRRTRSRRSAGSVRRQLFGPIFSSFGRDAAGNRRRRLPLERCASKMPENKTEYLGNDEMHAQGEPRTRARGGRLYNKWLCYGRGTARGTCQQKSCNYKTSHLKTLSCGIIRVILRFYVQPF